MLRNEDQAGEAYMSLGNMKEMYIPFRSSTSVPRDFSLRSMWIL